MIFDGDLTEKCMVNKAAAAIGLQKDMTQGGGEISGRVDGAADHADGGKAGRYADDFDY